MKATFPVTDSFVIPASDQEAWDRVLNQFPEALQDIHLTARYHQLYERNGDGQARLFVFKSNEETYCMPFLIRPIDGLNGIEGSYDSESAYGYSGPVSTTAESGFLKAADETFREYCNSVKLVTEFVRFHPLLDNQRFVPEGSGMQVIRLRDYVTVDLSCGLNERMDRYSAQNRNKIRKAEKAGVHVVEDPSTAQFATFIDIYVENMRQLHASRMYFFSDAYFHELRSLIKRDGVLLLALGPEGILGAAVFLASGSYSHYFLSSVTANGRQLGVGNLLLHEGINWAADRGARIMHLGGGLTADPADPLLTFKLNFSKTTVPFFIGKRIHDETAYRKILEAWEKKHGIAAGAFGNILQRYRWTDEDLGNMR
ncbi:MAG: GNAT family N-acetyltransferase [Bacteroidota bacterium]